MNKVIPFGSMNNDKHWNKFDPKKTVEVCYFLYDLRWSLGFVQWIIENKKPLMISGVFIPRIETIERDGGWIKYNTKTYNRFYKLWVETFGFEPELKKVVKSVT